MNTETTSKIYGIALALTLGLAATVSVRAQGDIYVVDGNGVDDGYNLDGFTVDAPLFSAGVKATGSGIAISGNELFVLNGDGAIGKYTYFGTTVNASLIPGVFNPIAIVSPGNNPFAGDSGSAGSGPPGMTVTDSTGAIGEYGTSETTVNTSLISGLDQSTSIAISRNNPLVANVDGTIGEYTTSRTSKASIGIGSYVNGIAISGNAIANGGTGSSSLSAGTANSSANSGPGGRYGAAIPVGDLLATGSFGIIGEYRISEDSLSAQQVSELASELPPSLVTRVPEPSSVALAGLGSAMFWLWVWRRRRYN